ncbi:MAG TPA: class I SAM-dependent methyltransferase [Vicinamibacteria bacterium]
MAEQADVETSSEGYARRFAGPVGEWFLGVQERTTLELLGAWPGATVVDVGGGHAQTAPPLARAGYAVTVVGSEPSCATRLQAHLGSASAPSRPVQFETADLLRLPFADRSFDVALSYRLLPHVTRWRELVGELARVARSVVVVDYPTRRSLNLVAEGLFAVKKGVEGNTRPFTVFEDREIEAAFAAHGFRVTARRPQFFWPMALHRALGAAPFSRALEAAAAGLGLRHLLGSPVILRLERRG